MKNKEYSYDFEITIRMDDGEEFQKGFTMELECTEKSRPGSFNPYDGGHPPEGPEFDFKWMHTEKQPVGNWTEEEHWSWGVALGFFGEKRMEAIFDDACEEAMDTGDF